MPIYDDDDLGVIIDQSANETAANDDETRAPHRSDKQTVANRINAGKSTGPRTATGKETSSRNATTHGVYADGAVRVARGSFAEDGDELARYVSDIVHSLAPRDGVERAQAHVVAGFYNQLRRLNIYEASCLAGDGKPGISDADGKAHVAGLSASIALSLHEILCGAVAVDDINVEAMTHRLLELAGKERPTVRDLWTDERTPQTPEEWKRVFRVIVHHYWPSEKDAAEWALNQHSYFSRLHEILDGGTSESAAARILSGTLDRSTKLRSRIGTELARALDRYSKLQQRELDNPTADEIPPECAKAGQLH